MALRKWAYIAGPMTGYPELNFPAFHQAAKIWRRRNGWGAVNPAEINPDVSADWTECMLEDIKQLSKCDVIYMLKGWEHSYGAQIEYLVAKKLGIKVEYESEYDL